MKAFVKRVLSGIPQVKQMMKKVIENHPCFKCKKVVVKNMSRQLLRLMMINMATVKINDDQCGNC